MARNHPRRGKGEGILGVRQRKRGGKEEDSRKSDESENSPCPVKS